MTLMLKAFGITLFSLLVTPKCFSSTQVPSNMTEPFVSYYQFYNGIQMVKVDYILPWKSEIRKMERMAPRGEDYATDYPPPKPIVYLFRDTSGTIVKSYNYHGENIQSIDLFFLPVY